MALTFPLSLAAFADRLNIQSVNWRLERYDELSGLGSGDILAAQLAPPRIVGDVELVPMYHAAAAQVQALIESLDGAINSFYLYAPQMSFPQADPEGLKLQESPTLSLDFTRDIGWSRSIGRDAYIEAMGSNNKSLRLGGLPPGYQITVGDYLSFDYGGGPTRRALHRSVETVTASSAGITSLMEVRPHLRPGVLVGLSVGLRKPAAKVFIVPGSFNPGTASDVMTVGMSFQVMQRP